MSGAYAVWLTMALATIAFWFFATKISAFFLFDRITDATKVAGHLNRKSVWHRYWICLGAWRIAPVFAFCSLLFFINSAMQEQLSFLYIGVLTPDADLTGLAIALWIISSSLPVAAWGAAVAVAARRIQKHDGRRALNGIQRVRVGMMSLQALSFNCLIFFIAAVGAIGIITPMYVSEAGVDQAELLRLVGATCLTTIALAGVSGLLASRLHWRARLVQRALDLLEADGEARASRYSRLPGDGDLSMWWRLAAKNLFSVGQLRFAPTVGSVASPEQLTAYFTATRMRKLVETSRVVRATIPPTVEASVERLRTVAIGSLSPSDYDSVWNELGEQVMDGIQTRRPLARLANRARGGLEGADLVAGKVRSIVFTVIVIGLAFYVVFFSPGWDKLEVSDLVNLG